MFLKQKGFQGNVWPTGFNINTRRLSVTVSLVMYISLIPSNPFLCHLTGNRRHQHRRGFSFFSLRFRSSHREPRQLLHPKMSGTLLPGLSLPSKTIWRHFSSLVIPVTDRSTLPSKTVWRHFSFLNIPITDRSTLPSKTVWRHFSSLSIPMTDRSTLPSKTVWRHFSSLNIPMTDRSTQPFTPILDDIKTWVTNYHFSQTKQQQNRSSSLSLFFFLEIFRHFPPWLDYSWLSHFLLRFCQKPSTCRYILDSKLSMKKHVITICQTAYFQLKRSGSIRPQVSHWRRCQDTCYFLHHFTAWLLQLSPYG